MEINRSTPWHDTGGAFSDFPFGPRKLGRARGVHGLQAGTSVAGARPFRNDAAGMRDVHFAVADRDDRDKRYRAVETGKRSLGRVVGVFYRGKRDRSDG